MNVIRCKYNILTKTPCGANNCSCRKIGLLYISAYGDCHGKNCNSVSKFKIMDDSEDQSFERNAFELFGI